jgi:hypothetical protein
MKPQMQIVCGFWFWFKSLYDKVTEEKSNSTENNLPHIPGIADLAFENFNQKKPDKQKKGNN